MLHEEFADRVAGRLEARADELGQDRHLVSYNTAEVRARVLRLAADVALEEAVTVTQEEAPPRRPEAGSERDGITRNFLEIAA